MKDRENDIGALWHAADAGVATGPRRRQRSEPAHGTRIYFRPEQGGPLTAAPADRHTPGTSKVIAAYELLARPEGALPPDTTTELVRGALGEAVSGTAGHVVIAGFDDTAAALSAGWRLDSAARKHNVTIRFAVVPYGAGTPDAAIELLGLARPGDAVVAASLRPVAPDPGNDYFAIRALDGSGGLDAYRVMQHGARWHAAVAPTTGLVGLAVTQPALGTIFEEELEGPPLPSLLQPGGAEAGISIFAFSPDQDAMAQNALAKFDAYDMPIPDEYPLRIYFHEPRDYESCGGHAALATHGADFEQIDICTSGEFALLHELSHVWANFEMDDGERAEFIELRDLEVWQGAPEWSANASEHSASIIAWGLGDTEVIPTMIPDHTRAELEHAFAFLTDNQTPVFLLPDEPIAPDAADEDEDDDPLNVRVTSPSGIPIPTPQEVGTTASAADAGDLTADSARDLLLPEDDLAAIAGDAMEEEAIEDEVVAPPFDPGAPDALDDDELDPADRALIGATGDDDLDPLDDVDEDA